MDNLAVYARNAAMISVDWSGMWVWERIRNVVRYTTDDIHNAAA